MIKASSHHLQAGKILRKVLQERARIEVEKTTARL